MVALAALASKNKACWTLHYSAFVLFHKLSFVLLSNFSDIAFCTPEQDTVLLFFSNIGPCFQNCTPLSTSVTKKKIRNCGKKITKNNKINNKVKK